MSRIIQAASSAAPIFQFSICTLVTDRDEYAAMKGSFVTCGFTSDCEYLMADNTRGNTVDAYAAVNWFLSKAKGAFLLIVHQDVRCIDKREMLENCLAGLSAADTKWAVCGNAGRNGYHEKRTYITNGGKIITTAPLPAPVKSLDENMLIINNNKQLSLPDRLTGFHLYGTAICIEAMLRGYTCYTIPFMVKHLSLGNVRELDSFVPAFISAYNDRLPGRYMETMCTRFYLGGSARRNRLLNSPYIFPLIKFKERIKEIIRKMVTGKKYRTISAPER